MERHLHHRALAWLLLLCVLLAVLVVGALPLWERYQATRQAVAEIREQVANTRKAVARAEHLMAQPESGPEAINRFLLPGDSQALAAAALQSRVETLVDQRGGQIFSTHTILGEEQQGLAQVSIRVRLALTTSVLQQVLFDLEGQLPLLVIDYLKLASYGGHDPYIDSALNAEIQISGWVPVPVEDHDA